MSSARLIVKNLPWTISKYELKQYLAQFGRVGQCNVLFDRNTGLSRGIGFVSVNNPETMNKIMENSHTLEGNVIYFDLQTNAPGRGRGQYQNQDE